MAKHRLVCVIANYYSSHLEKVDDIRYFEESGILVSDAIVFLKDMEETKDGIKVVLSKEEVLSRLGKGNLSFLTLLNPIP
ncbi:hypothetical protein [Paenibacillus crassostreae]|uniref:Uncharacterized protein n=1 Tax=Paenibacillus crassostreae TaxID=1763538 RepID=A0A162N8B9_9BACL|nr:hypothetical protein [Paenibacillus crassostreae]AOZ93666.1 hypothetical protein LPB68_16670 [Paenibacillus crassostreae]OAB71492.1 hypothetical protein PNBC_19540 [Paenibacillus crassostreae]